MKVLFIFLFAVILYSCTPSNSRQAALLKQELETVLTPSTAFDSLLKEVRALPPSERIAVLLSPSLCNKDPQAVAQQEPLLLEVLPLASKREKKRLLLRLIEVYKQQNNYTCILDPQRKCIQRCEEVEANYSLSQEERWQVMEAKAKMLSLQGQQNMCMPIWFKLLEEHRQEGETVKVVEDLAIISALLANIGDVEKGLETYQEGYQWAKKHGLSEQCKYNLIGLINLNIQLGRNEEALNICRQTGFDSLAVILPATYNILATCFLQMGKPDSARIYLQKGVQTSSIHKEDWYTFIRIARTFVDESNEDSATVYLQKAMRIYQREVDSVHQPNHVVTPPFGFLEVYPVFASLLQRNGKTAQAGQLFAWIEPAMKKTVRTLAVIEMQLDALVRYAAYCQATSQYEKGFKLMLRCDSLRIAYAYQLQENTNNNISERFKTQELLYTIEMQKKEFVYSQRALVVVSGTSAILLCAIGVFVYLYRKRQQQLAPLLSPNLEIEQLRDAADLTPAFRAPQAATTVSLNPIEELYRIAQTRVTVEKLFLNKELTLEQLARQLNTNRSYLSSCINTCSGNNFNQWINNYRINYVLDRIHSTPNLLALAGEAGFVSADSFYRHFKRCTQMTASEYLKASH